MNTFVNQTPAPITPAAKSTPAAGSLSALESVAPKETIEINIDLITKKLGIKNKKYPEVIQKNNLMVTNERLINYRQTLREIIEIKNGKVVKDKEVLHTP